MTDNHDLCFDCGDRFPHGQVCNRCDDRRFVLEIIKRLADLEQANRIDVTSAMNSIRALTASVLV